MPRSQVKLMAALSALVLLVVSLSGYFAERGLRERELKRIASSLEERAGMLLALLGDRTLAPAHRDELDAFADRMSAAAGARVTLIDADGIVVGDSEIRTDRLDRVENHGARAEVRAALGGAVGQDRRRSETIGKRLFYLAVPHPQGGAVRLALEPAELESAVSDLRDELLTASAIGLIAALALATALSWVTLRPLDSLRRTAAAIAGGDLSDRPPLRSGDELREISSAINQLAGQLRLRLEEATHEKERLEAVLDAMVEGVLVVDAKNEILLANSRLREFFDVWDEVTGRTPLEAIRDAELDAVMALAESTDEPVSRVIHVGRSTPRMVRVQAVRFPSGAGRRAGTVAVFHDVTDITRLEKIRRDFVANASHELRTPLAAIRGFTETLLSGRELSEADRKSYLEVIDRHARRLGNLVDDLLELSRIESRELSLSLDTVDVCTIAEGLHRDWRARFEERKIAVEIETSGRSEVWADPQAVEQILTNLLDNALKYTEAGGSITLRIDGDERSVVTEVRDTGIGIPERDRERIFERFYRVDKARSRALGGTGLGLSIVKHLVQSLGGEISVESRLGGGSTFRFTLPRAGGPGGRGEQSDRSPA